MLLEGVLKLVDIAKRISSIILSDRDTLKQIASICATAQNLELKIVAHMGELQFIEVQGQRKPFGPQVIEAHRLLKNSIDSDHYALISGALADHIGLNTNYSSKLYHLHASLFFIYLTLL